MPIQVVCPNGCVIQVSAKRAGKIIRCPECRSLIQVAKTGVPLDTENPGSSQTELSPLTAGSESNAAAPFAPAPVNTPEPRMGNVAGTQRLEIPAPVSIQKRRNAARRPQPILFEEDQPDRPRQAAGPTRLNQRVRSARADRIVLARFFAACLCLAGVVNLGPAIYYWIQWSQAIETTALPRWIYLQLFIAAIHFVYAVFVIQVLDWAALRTVGYAMLVMAGVFAVISTGLVIGGGAGVIGRFLELPYLLIGKATLWCVAMLCLSTLLCYVIGRESMNWRRIEVLLDQIAHGQSVSEA